MTGGAWILKPISLPPIRRSSISLVGMMLTLSQYLGLLARHAILTPERVNIIILLSITAPSTIVSFEISQDVLITGTSLIPVIILMNFSLPILRRTWMDIYINAMMLPISYAWLRIKYIIIWRPWIIITLYCSMWPRRSSPNVIWTRSIISRNRDIIPRAEMKLASLDTRNLATLLYHPLVTGIGVSPWKGKLTIWNMLLALI